MVIFTGLNANNIIAKEKIMNILKNKPVYQLSIKAFGAKYFIEVNGKTVFQELFSDGKIITTVPINHWMRSGANTIGIYVFPENPEGKIRPNASAAITLIVSDKDKPDIEQSVTNIVFSGKLLSDNKAVSNSSPSGKLDSNRDFSASASGDVEVFDLDQESVPNYEGAFHFSRTINIPSSLPLWAFFESDDVLDYDAMSDEDYYKHLDVLLAEYMKVQRALESGDINAVIPMFAERNKELDAAFYLEPGTMEKKIGVSLLEATDKNEYELVTLRKKSVNITTEDNRKLASLTREGDNSAIVLNFKKGQGSQSYPLIFRLKDGKWILTR